MTDKQKEKLQVAVERYVEGLDLLDLINYVEDDLWTHYWYGVSDEEKQDFIDAMQVSDEDVE